MPSLPRALALVALLPLLVSPVASAAKPPARLGPELRVDLDADRKPERAWLEALGPADNGFLPGVVLVVSPGRGGKPVRLTLKDTMAGYAPHLAALAGNRLLLRAGSGGSGGRQLYAVVAYRPGKLQLVASAEPPRGLPALAARFEPDYVVSVTIPGLGVRRVDIRRRKSLYEAEGVYENGQLTPKTPAIWGIVRPDSLGVGEAGRLEARYSLRGFVSADRPARVQLELEATPAGYKVRRAEVEAEPLQ